MLIALTGTPGTGKTTVSQELKKNGFEVIDLNQVASEQDFILGIDEERNSKIVDVQKLNVYVKKSYVHYDLVFIEGHLSHLLRSMDKIIILRCHPQQLEKRLQKKKWNIKKIRENIEAETLDIILCEALEIHDKKSIFEIDTTDRKPQMIVDDIHNILKGRVAGYRVGKIDWSEEVLKWYPTKPV